MSDKMLNLMVTAVVFMAFGILTLTAFESTVANTIALLLLMMAFAISCRLIAQRFDDRYYFLIIISGFAFLIVSALIHTTSIMVGDSLILKFIIWFVVFMTIVGPSSVAFWVAHKWLLEREEES